ncbi:hypothetical protein GCM10009706_10380 [Curtobacterium citreum]|nr:hypothetical protein GCM10009706_10380 [Curtobacterium citreum]
MARFTRSGRDSARDTVDGATPVASAMSRIVTRRAVSVSALLTVVTLSRRGNKWQPVAACCHGAGQWGAQPAAPPVGRAQPGGGFEEETPA